MSANPVRGSLYRCPVCGAEVAVLAGKAGDFGPRCCDTEMVLLRRRLVFYRCPVCGAELAVVRQGAGVFAPRCCDTDMRRLAA